MCVCVCVCVCVCARDAFVHVNHEPQSQLLCTAIMQQCCAAATRHQRDGAYHTGKL